ncbi:Tetratricopeptide repeat protein 25, partial [Gonapodya sp. JEL0774]
MDTSGLSKKPDAGSGSDDGDALPVSSFQSLQAEAENLFKLGEFPKSIEAFSKALELRPGDKATLVARSRCFLQIGDSQKALEDAEETLKDQPDFFKVKFLTDPWMRVSRPDSNSSQGIYHKAEALYAKGDFELALVYYHRGSRLRPESSDFRLGIQKAREAINNAIGQPDVQRPFESKKTSTPASAHHRDSAAWVLNYENGNKHALLSPSDALTTGGKSFGSRYGGAMDHGKKSAVDNSSASRPLSGSSSAARSVSADPRISYNQKSGRLLLGELSEDREYLEAFINDKGLYQIVLSAWFSRLIDRILRSDFLHHPNPAITDLVRQGIHYLDQRLEFWRQERPLYARTDKGQIREAARLRRREAEGIRQKALAAKEREGKKVIAEETQMAKLGLLGPKQMNPKEGSGRAQNRDLPKLPRTILVRQPTTAKLQTTHEKFVESTLQGISTALHEENYTLALNMSETFCAELADLHQVADRDEVMCEVYENAAEALMGLGKPREALKYLEKELELGNQKGFVAILPRALGSLGRVHVSLQQFENAISYWSVKLAGTAKDNADRLWLLHDLARCHLETGNVA